MEKELKTGFYYINISAGRGCYGNCSFCSTGKLIGTSYRRVRSVGNVLDEIEHFQKNIMLIILNLLMSYLLIKLI